MSQKLNYVDWFQTLIKSVANQQLNIMIEKNKIRQVRESKFLGVTLDQHLS